MALTSTLWLLAQALALVSAVAMAMAMSDGPNPGHLSAATQSSVALEAKVKP